MHVCGISPNPSLRAANWLALVQLLVPTSYDIAVSEQAPVFMSNVAFRPIERIKRLPNIITGCLRDQEEAV